MNVKGWKCVVIEDTARLTCPVCGQPIPNPNITNGDFCYSPIWESTDMDFRETVERVFDIKAPDADFFICQECFGDGGSLSPVWWVRKWIEEDAKLVSRDEALAILEGKRKGVPDGSSANEGAA